MTLNDPLANVLSHILNCGKVGKPTCIVRPASKLIKNCLRILENKNYIGKFNVTEGTRGGVVKINLIGKINNCNVIKPRFNVKNDNYEKFEKRFLPAKDFGIIIVSTPKGLMTHIEAKEKGIGGKLILYCY